MVGWHVFVAHNAHFDYSFLKKEFEDVGITWNTKKLCTVRLSRKIIPGLHSYGLGRLAESLGIKIPDRHRAGGDALATAKIFDTLLKRDNNGTIVKALKRNSGETILPPNLPREDLTPCQHAQVCIIFWMLMVRLFMLAKPSTLKKELRATSQAMHANGIVPTSEMKSITSRMNLPAAN